MFKMHDQFIWWLTLSCSPLHESQQMGSKPNQNGLLEALFGGVPKYWNTTKCDKIRQNSMKYDQIRTNTTKYYQTRLSRTKNTNKINKIRPNTTKYDKIRPNSIKYDQIRQIRPNRPNWELLTTKFSHI